MPIFISQKPNVYEPILDLHNCVRLLNKLHVFTRSASHKVIPVFPALCQEYPYFAAEASRAMMAASSSDAPKLDAGLLATEEALMAEERAWGLFNNFDLPANVAMFTSMLMFDFAIYLQHIMFHAVPGLWRLHRMHHADLDFDATTGLRFHPVEILISMAIFTVLGTMMVWFMRTSLDIFSRGTRENRDTVSRVCSHSLHCLPIQ